MAEGGTGGTPSPTDDTSSESIDEEHGQKADACVSPTAGQGGSRMQHRRIEMRMSVPLQFMMEATYNSTHAASGALERTLPEDQVEIFQMLAEMLNTRWASERSQPLTVADIQWLRSSDGQAWLLEKRRKLVGQAAVVGYLCGKKAAAWEGLLQVAARDSTWARLNEGSTQAAASNVAAQAAASNEASANDEASPQAAASNEASAGNGAAAAGNEASAENEAAAPSNEALASNEAAPRVGKTAAVKQLLAEALCSSALQSSTADLQSHMLMLGGSICGGLGRGWTLREICPPTMMMGDSRVYRRKKDGCLSLRIVICPCGPWPHSP